MALGVAPFSFVSFSFGWAKENEKALIIPQNQMKRMEFGVIDLS
jgi:hypothetical protein